MRGGRANTHEITQGIERGRGLACPVSCYRSKETVGER